MATRRWLLIGFAAALAGGCAHRATSVSVIDERVARLPPDERQRIVHLQQIVDAARSNVQAARVARDDARQFLSIADDELRAARSRLDAARGAVGLASRAQDPVALDAAERERRAAEQQVIAARLKRDYADRLVALRQAERREREAEADVARADLDAIKLAALNRHGLAADVPAPSFDEARRQARAELARRRQRVGELSGEVANLRAAWEQQQRAVASRPAGEPLLPPAPPAPLPPTDVNEGPAAPQSMPNPNLAH